MRTNSFYEQDFIEKIGIQALGFLHKVPNVKTQRSTFSLRSKRPPP